MLAASLQVTPCTSRSLKFQAMLEIRKARDLYSFFSICLRFEGNILDEPELMGAMG